LSCESPLSLSFDENHVNLSHTILLLFVLCCPKNKIGK
jgi:hypothetical protein